MTVSVSLLYYNFDAIMLLSIFLCTFYPIGSIAFEIISKKNSKILLHIQK